MCFIVLWCFSVLFTTVINASERLTHCWYSTLQAVGINSCEPELCKCLLAETDYAETILDDEIIYESEINFICSQAETLALPPKQNKTNIRDKRKLLLELESHLARPQSVHPEHQTSKHQTVFLTLFMFSVSRLTLTQDLDTLNANSSMMTIPLKTLLWASIIVFVENRLKRWCVCVCVGRVGGWGWSSVWHVSLSENN